MSTKFYLENGYLIVGRADCSRCGGSGEVLSIFSCDACGGTGAGPRGGEKGCRACAGTGEQWGPDYETCPVCKGKDSNQFEPGRLTDQIPFQMLMLLPVEFWDHNPEPGGKIIEVHDAGRTLGWTARPMIGLAVLELSRHPVPAIKMVKQDERGLRYADRIVIYHDQYGYVIKPVWDKTE